jgi:hypothetical protein
VAVIPSNARTAGTVQEATMTRTDTTTTLTPALVTVLRRAPVVASVQPWEPTTLHPSVARRPAVTGTVPLPGQALFGTSGAFELGRAPKHLRTGTTPVWAVAAVLAAFVTLFAGSLASVLAQRTPAAPSPAGSSVSAPVQPAPPSLRR